MKHLLILLISTVVLAGCSSNSKKTTSVTPASVNWTSHFQHMASIKHWQASAKFAISSNNQTKSAKLSWKQDNDLFDIEFSGPLGYGGPRLIGDDNSATLTIPKEEPIKSSNTSSLLQRKFGWQLPVENAKFWMLGIPSPLTESKVVLKDERLLTLIQDGWTINYSKYVQVDNNYRPSKIIITRDNLKILLVIYKWHEESLLNAA